jgi:flagellar hook-basal body complex protein FliE
MINGISNDMMFQQVDQLRDSIGIDQGINTTEEAPGGFKEMLGKLVNEVDQAQKSAEVSLEKLATGETNSIQEVVIKMEEADISFQLMKEIRNKLLSAFKEVMSMSA